MEISYLESCEFDLFDSDGIWVGTILQGEADHLANEGASVHGFSIQLQPGQSSYIATRGEMGYN